MPRPMMLTTLSTYSYRNLSEASIHKNKLHGNPWTSGSLGSIYLISRILPGSTRIYVLETWSRNFIPRLLAHRSSTTIIFYKLFAYPIEHAAKAEKHTREIVMRSMPCLILIKNLRHHNSYALSPGLIALQIHFNTIITRTRPSIHLEEPESSSSREHQP
ncbi:hypothetical protein WAI453_013390 [Rhynchosporium graminicola]